MTDFSFTNKGYDLIQSILSEPKPKLEKPEDISLNEIRLIVDMTKDLNPMFADADDNTLIDLVADTFKVNVTKEELEKINHTADNLYRPIDILEIEPGVKIKIYEGDYYYFHNFWLYADTYQSIQPNRFKSYNDYVLARNKALMDIWNKSKQGKALIKNTFKHRIEDKVSHKDDPNSRGIIKARRMSDKYENEYAVYWAYLSDKSQVDFKYWDKENNLINKTLEALPMKIVNKTRFKKCIAIVSYKTLKHREEVDSTTKEIVKKYWYEECEDRIPIGTHCSDINAYVRKLYPETIQGLKIIRTELWNSINPIEKKHSVKKITYVRKRKCAQTPGTPKKLGDQKKLKFKKPIIPAYSSNILPDKNNNPVNTKLVCVKYLAGVKLKDEDPSDTIFVVSRIPIELAKKLVNKENGMYQYCSKAEWRQYLNTVGKNKEKFKPGLNLMEKDSLTRKARRSDLQKVTKGSRLVKEQFIEVKKPKETVTITSLKPTLKMYDEENNETMEFFESTFVKPARTILKRIIVVFKPHKRKHSGCDKIKITPRIIENRKKRSILDLNKYLEKKAFKSLPELKKMFAKDERRNGHFSSNEKWSHSFERLLILATTGRLLYLEKNIDLQLKKHDKIPERTITYWVNYIIKTEHGFKWTDEKIADFMRYLRLTSRGIFEEPKTKSERLTGNRPDKLNKNGIVTVKGKPYKKKARIKKSLLPKIFRPSKFITRLDNTKLKYNIPGEDKPLVIKFEDTTGEYEREGIYSHGKMWDGDNILCELKNVTAWHYVGDTEFTNVLSDSGGGIMQIPIKFKWIVTEELKKFFDKNKLKKLPI